MTQAHEILTQITARMIRDLGPSPSMTKSLWNLHSDPNGAEILRSIVRDNVANAGDIVYDALSSENPN